MKLKALILNNYDNHIEIFEIKAKNEEKAYEKMDEMRHNQEYFVILNEERWSNLIRIVAENKKSD